uniref:Iron-binding zinc finger CDGSH type domain-containing protein n=1 Tax=Xiphophorus couchianus TaxID=32473 RepID=A0A3B5LVA4_9TELE
MITLFNKLHSRWLSFTFRHPRTAATAAPKKPIKVELVGGKRYSWCTCGYSRKQPFCDGTHKTRAQGMKGLRFVPEKDSTVWLCGCKHTNNPPYCDGTHKQDFIVSAPLHEYTD